MASPRNAPDDQERKQGQSEGQEINLGQGGEIHQTAGENVPTLTTQQGMPVSDDQNSLSVGYRGPSALEDSHLREKILHFDHERIPERVVHARGFGAHGYFETYESLSAITSADIFQRAGERTPAFVRFSTVAGSRGSFDLARDVRGFAVKLYTKEGNWDLVGNNIPVFFIQDAIKFPDLIHAAKPEPDRAFPQAQTAHDNFWDFISLMPESMHMIMWIMSDRAIPRSFRFMEGFGVHTFRLVNAEGKSTFVKFHWKPKLGLQSVVWNEAVKINGADPDFHRRDLWNAIQMGNYPEWELGLQLFDEEFAERFAFDVLDATKIIPEEDVPVRRVGRLVLDRCVDNFFAETEQVAFCTQNIVPGIDFYEPNSWGERGGPREAPERGFHSYPSEESGPKLRVRPESFADHYSQARQFYISQTGIEQRHIAEALVFELSKVERPDIRSRVVSHLLNIDEGLAKQVVNGLRLKEMPQPAQATRPTRKDLEKSAPLSILRNGPGSFKGRKIGVLLTDGADAKIFNALQKAAMEEGATIEVIAPMVGGIQASDGSWIDAAQKIDGGPSVLYDAVALLTSEDSVQTLAKEPTARDFVSDAFAHFKFIGYSKAAIPLMEKAGIAEALDEACITLVETADAVKFVRECRNIRFWDRGQ